MTDHPRTDKIAAALAKIAVERRRQVAKGYTPDHDLHHSRGEMARAAAVYATPTIWRDLSLYPRGWVFAPTPRDRVAELVKAGALIVAEIERLTS